jgi:hypothetical protein
MVDLIVSNSVPHESCIFIYPEMKRLLTILSFLSVVSLAQDSLRIMYFNALNFPDLSPDRADTLRKVIHYTKPDVFVINELQTESGADIILNQAMNQFGVSSYQRAAFVDGNDTDNMLYYNSDKLGFISQLQIETTLRDFSEYVLFYKSPGLGASSDTVYLNFYSAHLKAGVADFAQRADEAQVLKFHLNTRPDIENVFVGGDFNFYSGNEEGCFILRTSGSVPLNDPIDQIGDWSGNAGYADIHTQSTRTSGFGGGSGGGMDDRFDLIFVSDDVLNNSNGVQFITGSYEALGQDGLRFNQTIITPANTVVPDSVANALYWISDHLPVMMDVVLDYTAEIPELDVGMAMLYDFKKQLIFIKNPVENSRLQIVNLTGQIIRDLEADDSYIYLKKLAGGTYIARLISGDQQHSLKFSVPIN